MPAGGWAVEIQKLTLMRAARCIVLENFHFWGLSRGPDLQGCGCYGGISDSVCCRLAIPDFKKDNQRFSHRGCLSGSCKKTRKDMEIFFGSPEIFFLESRSRREKGGWGKCGEEEFFLRRSLPVIPRRLWVSCFAILVMPCWRAAK